MLEQSHLITAVILDTRLAGFIRSPPLFRLRLQLQTLERAAHKSPASAALEVNIGLIERLTGRCSDTGADAVRLVCANLLAEAQANSQINNRL